MNEILDKIKKLRADQAVLIAQLDRSLAIERICPGIFKVGTVTSYWHGNIYKTMTFTVKVAAPGGKDYITFDFTPSELPEILKATAPTEYIMILDERKRKRDVLDRLRG